MKFFNIVLLATSAAALAVETRFLQGRNRVDHEAAILARHNAGQGSQGLRNGSGSGRNGRNRGGNQGGVGGNPGNGTVPINNSDDNNGDTTTDDDTSAGDGTGAATGETLVLKEINSIPGEIVDAACVNDAADRQMTPTTLNGASVLRVQRSFTAGFRPDLVDVEACVGFNGTHFRAQDCAASGIELVQFDGSSLRAPSGACASGHDDLAQVTVDPSGATCALFDTAAVTPTPP